MSVIATCRLGEDVLARLDAYAAEHAKGSRSAAIEQLVRRQLAIPAVPAGEGQSRASGSAAAAFGREAAAFLAGQLGAARIAGEPANIYCLADGTRTLIKSSRATGDRINVLPSVLGRFHSLHVGFWNKDGTQCDLFDVPAALFARYARRVSRARYLQIDRGMIEGLELPARTCRRG